MLLDVFSKYISPFLYSKTGSCAFINWNASNWTKVQRGWAQEPWCIIVEILLYVFNVKLQYFFIKVCCRMFLYKKDRLKEKKTQ